MDFILFYIAYLLGSSFLLALGAFINAKRKQNIIKKNKPIIYTHYGI